MHSEKWLIDSGEGSFRCLRDIFLCSVFLKAAAFQKTLAGEEELFIARQDWDKNHIAATSTTLPTVSTSLQITTSLFSCLAALYLTLLADPSLLNMAAVLKRLRFSQKLLDHDHDSSIDSRLISALLQGGKNQF